MTFVFFFFLVITYFNWGGLTTQFTPHPYPIGAIYMIYIEVKPELGGLGPPAPPQIKRILNF